MAIRVNSLRKEYSTRAGSEVAVSGIDFSVDEGEFVTIVGPSGCGKTTTLRCIAGLETPTSGEISFDGEDLTEVPASKRNMAMMFQNIALYPHMKTVDNIAYPLKVRGVPKAVRYERARDSAELMQIPELLEKYPGELSGGQRQRAALCRTIVQDPRAFLMDEPLSDLDAKLKVEIRKEIQRVHQRVQKPTIYVTHDQEEAMTMSDKIIVMNDGEIEQQGSPDDLYDHPENVFVAKFIGNPSMNLVDGEVESVDEHDVAITAYDTRFDFEVSEFRGEPTGRRVTIGFRPGNVRIHEDGESDTGLSGTIELIERIGNQVLATLDSPSGEIRAIVPADYSIEEAQQVSIEFADESVHVFDANTGEIVAHC